MQRLDELLDRLARRGRHDTIEPAIDRLERRLAGEDQVVALWRRDEMGWFRWMKHHRAFVAVAAALVVGLAIGGPLWFLGAGEERDGAAEITATTSGTPTSTTTPANTTEPVPVITTEPSSPASTATAPPPTNLPPLDSMLLADGWRFGPLDPPLPAGVSFPSSEYESIHGLAASPLGMVMIGQLDFVTPAHRRSIVWYSADADTWEQVGSDVFATAEVKAIAAGGPGFVAVGNDCSIPDLERCEADPAVWTSSDGRIWQRIPHDPSIFPGCSDQGGHEVRPDPEEMLTACAAGMHRPTIEYVTATGDGLIAIGADPTWTLLWYSPDGLVWNRVDGSASPSYPLIDEKGWWIYTLDPGAWTSTGLIQPGFRCIDIDDDETCAKDCYGFIWSSISGEEWSPETWNGEVLDEWWPVVTVESGSGIVIFGNRSASCSFCPMGVEPEPTTVVALHSVDGEEWTQVTLPSADSGRVWPQSVSASPIGLIAMAEQAWEPELVAMWHSNDGLEWDLVPAIQGAPDGLWVNSLTWEGTGFILLGSAADDGERVNVIGRWTKP